MCHHGREPTSGFGVRGLSRYQRTRPSAAVGPGVSPGMAKIQFLGGCPRINVCGLLILGERGGACVPIDAPVETASDSDRNAQFTEGLTPCKGPCGTPQASALRLRR